MEKRRVKIDSGELQGIFGYDPRITVFKGVPYAAPPVGELRWHAPQPVEPWEGVRLAAEYGPMSIQETPGADPKEFWTKELHPAGPEFEMSEDCLYLNVFTPAKRGNENLPVLFYIHGGGLTGGYPYEIEFDWEHVARKGVVVVTPTYRLGVMGFLSHPWLTAEHPEEPKGNYGYQDQLAALRWVQRNIRAFGGDPEKVTIAGQSAGAGSVLSQLSSPMARDTFRAAIVQFGVVYDFKDLPGRKPLTLADAEKIGEAFFEENGIHSLEEARKIPGLEVHKMARKNTTGMGIRFTPPIDGKYTVEPSTEALDHDHWGDKKVIFGYTGDEVGMFNKFCGALPETMEEYRELAKRYGDKEEEFLTVTGCKTDDDVKRLAVSKAYTAMVASTYLAADTRTRQGHTAYIYEFNADIPGEDHPGSYHGSELPFAYDALARMWRPYSGYHYDLARQVNSYWINFVKTGDPNGLTNNGETLPEWPAFTTEDPRQMFFTDHSESKKITVDPVMKLRHSLQ